VLLAGGELAWLAFGASELAVLAVAGLLWGLLRLAARSRGRSVRRVRVAEQHRARDRRETRQHLADQAVEADEYGWEQRRTAGGRGR